MSEPGQTEIDSQKPVNNLDRLNSRIYVKGDLSGLHLNRENVVAECREVWLKQREDILKLPSWEVGLRMDRVDSFRESMGAPRKTLRILSPENYAIANAIVGKDLGTEEGQYLLEQDLIIVKRDPELELVNGGPDFIESLVIHEMAHSATDNSNIRIDVVPQRRFLRKTDAMVSSHAGRMGFVVTNDKGNAEGYFLEEGYAELERGLYVTQILGKPNGFTGRPQSDFTSPIDKYNVFNKKGQWGLPPGSLPAITLELLIKHDSEFLSSLRKSRSSVEGLREIIRHINAISPGLYQELRKIEDIKSKDGYAKSVNIAEKIANILSQNGSIASS